MAKYDVKDKNYQAGCFKKKPVIGWGHEIFLVTSL